MIKIHIIQVVLISCKKFLAECYRENIVKPFSTWNMMKLFVSIRFMDRFNNA